jgi:MFS family permease
MPSGRFRGWVNVAVCFFLIFLFAGAGFYSFSVFIPPLEKVFGWDRAAIALAMSIYMISGGLVSPITGKLVEKFGSKRIMVMSGVLAGACYMLVSLTHSIGYYYVIYGLLAVCTSGIGIIPATHLIACWFKYNRGLATGIVMMGFSAGGMMMAPLINFTTSQWGWESAYLLIGGMVWGLALPAVIIFIREAPSPYGRPMSDDDAQRTRTDSRKHHGRNTSHAPLDEINWPAPAAFRAPVFRRLALGFFLAPLAQMGILQHQVPMLMAKGLSQTSAATALGIIAGLGALGKVVFGRLSETIDHRWVFAACYGLQTAGTLMLWGAVHPAMLYGYIVVYGFAMGGAVVLLPLSVSQFFGISSYGVIFGMLWAIQTVGGALGTYISGFIFDLNRSYAYALVLFAGAYLIALAAFISAGNPRPFVEDGDSSRPQR